MAESEDTDNDPGPDAGMADYFEENPVGGGEELPEFREITDGVWAQGIQFDVGNALTVDTGPGLVQVDTGLNEDCARTMIERIRTVTDKPIQTICYSHGHTGYNHGITAWFSHNEDRGDPRPRVVAHVGVIDRYARYRETMRYQELLNEWQFGFDEGSMNGMFTTLVDPDVTFTDELVVGEGERTVIHRSSPSETADGTCLWLPDDKLLYSGNSVIGSFPNSGSPQRTVRDPGRWIETLTRHLELDIDILVREYGIEIKDRDLIRRIITTTRDALEWVRHETIARINQGMLIEDIVNDLDFPQEWADLPWIPQTYGCPEFVARDAYRMETGWWDHNITNLHPASLGAAATAVASAITDKRAVLDRAEELRDQGQPQLALHVIDVLALSPGDEALVVEARVLKADIAEQMADAAPTYMSANFYRTASRKA